MTRKTLVLHVMAIALLLAAACIVAACSSSEHPPQVAQTMANGVAPTQSEATVPSPATFSVIAGRADGAMDIEQFMPAAVHLRVGDAIEWTAQGFEGHTITFATDDQFRDVVSSYLVTDPEDPAQLIFNPAAALRSDTGATFAGDGTYTNSGFIGVPAAATYKLTFTKKGVYRYVCLVHPFTMRGVVTVDDPDARVEPPETVAAAGEAEYRRYLQTEKDALAAAEQAPREIAGPDGTTVHRIAVGTTTPYGQVAAFTRSDLDIKAGDTVIFENDDRDFHNVVFRGAMAEPPAGIGIRVDPGGRGINYIVDKASAAVDPPAEGFDETTFLSSGMMGITRPRQTWQLRFDKPGTYVFNCTIHVLAGMAGVIRVSAR